MGSLDDVSTCVVCGVGGTDVKLSNKQVCTSCAQKVEHCKIEDGASDNSGKIITSADIDAVSNSIEKIGICNDDDDGDELFQDPPPKEECQICMLPMPFSSNICGIKKVYQPCCGKTLCYGCVIAANDEMNKGNMKRLCPFCRFPIHNTDKEYLKRVKKRMQINDPEAFYFLGSAYRFGSQGLRQNEKKALELWERAAELGSITAHYCLAEVYRLGSGVEKDMDKAIHHYKLAAIRGHEIARYDLGVLDGKNYNIQAIKHFIISAKAGHDDSLKMIGVGYKEGLVTKEEYAKTLREYKDCWDSMRSEERAIS